MTTIHLVKTEIAFKQCIRLATSQDLIVLTGSSVQLLLTPFALTKYSYRVLLEDIEARGLKGIADKDKVVSIDELALLFVSYDRQVAW